MQFLLLKGKRKPVQKTERKGIYRFLRFLPLKRKKEAMQATTQKGIPLESQEFTGSILVDVFTLQPEPADIIPIDTVALPPARAPFEELLPSLPSTPADTTNISASSSTSNSAKELQP